MASAGARVAALALAAAVAAVLAAPASAASWAMPSNADIKLSRFSGATSSSMISSFIPIPGMANQYYAALNNDQKVYKVVIGSSVTVTDFATTSFNVLSLAAGTSTSGTAYVAAAGNSGTALVYQWNISSSASSLSLGASSSPTVTVASADLNNFYFIDTSSGQMTKCAIGSTSCTSVTRSALAATATMTNFPSVTVAANSMQSYPTAICANGADTTGNSVIVSVFGVAGKGTAGLYMCSFSGNNNCMKMTVATTKGKNMYDTTFSATSANKADEEGDQMPVIPTSNVDGASITGVVRASTINSNAGGINMLLVTITSRVMTSGYKGALLLVGYTDSSTGVVLSSPFLNNMSPMVLKRDPLTDLPMVFGLSGSGKYVLSYQPLSSNPGLSNGLMFASNVQPTDSAPYSNGMLFVSSTSNTIYFVNSMGATMPWVTLPILSGGTAGLTGITIDYRNGHVLVVSPPVASYTGGLWKLQALSGSPISFYSFPTVASGNLKPVMYSQVTGTFSGVATDSHQRVFVALGLGAATNQGTNGVLLLGSVSGPSGQFKIVKNFDFMPVGVTTINPPSAGSLGYMTVPDIAIVAGYNSTTAKLWKYDVSTQQATPVKIFNFASDSFKFFGATIDPANNVLEVVATTGGVSYSLAIYSWDMYNQSLVVNEGTLPAVCNNPASIYYTKPGQSGTLSVTCQMTAKSMVYFSIEPTFSATAFNELRGFQDVISMYLKDHNIAPAEEQKKSKSDGKSDATARVIGGLGLAFGLLALIVEAAMFVQIMRKIRQTSMTELR